MPKTYVDFEKLRDVEFPRLDASNQVYLDYTGSGLYPNTLTKKQYSLLNENVYGNPHSENPASATSTEYVRRARARILQYFHASPSLYEVIFTSNASNAIKLVAESFPFNSQSVLGLLEDNHNSVLGIREYATAAGAKVAYAHIDSNMRAANVQDFLRRDLQSPANLFAYPAQSNFSGVQHSLSYVKYAQEHRWYVLLDVAAFVPTSRLDLSVTFPDFVPVSFYKMLGLPTGVGALIVRKKILKHLKRPWFAGGTVRYSSVHTGAHSLHRNGEAFEDGTLDFLNIALVTQALEFMDRIGINNIHAHVKDMTHHIIVGLTHLQYRNGKPMVRIYGPQNTKERGGCVAFDLLSISGNRRNETNLVKAASEWGISIRSGCFCNPGAAERALKRDFQREEHCLRKLGRNVNGESMSKCLGASVGCARVSVGVATNYADVDKFLKFLHSYSLDFAA